jgi:hypothetical protein
VRMTAHIGKPAASMRSRISAVRFGSSWLLNIARISAAMASCHVLEPVAVARQRRLQVVELARQHRLGDLVGGVQGQAQLALNLQPWKAALVTKSAFLYIGIVYIKDAPSVTSSLFT